MMKEDFTDEVRVSSQPIYDMKSGSTWLGWNVADLPPAFLHVRLHLASDTEAPRCRVYKKTAV